MVFFFERTERGGISQELGVGRVIVVSLSVGEHNRKDFLEHFVSVSAFDAIGKFGRHVATSVVCFVLTLGRLDCLTDTSCLVLEATLSCSVLVESCLAV